jgi:hypothetical protein
VDVHGEKLSELCGGSKDVHINTPKRSNNDFVNMQLNKVLNVPKYLLEA